MPFCLRCIAFLFAYTSCGWLGTAKTYVNMTLAYSHIISSIIMISWLVAALGPAAALSVTKSESGICANFHRGEEWANRPI